MIHPEASGGMTGTMHMVLVSIEDPLPREEAVDMHGRLTGLRRDRFLAHLEVLLRGPQDRIIDREVVIVAIVVAGAGALGGFADSLRLG